MTIPLRQSTASQEIPLGYLLDSTDGDTEETGLTIANTDIKLWKHGATTLANKNSGGATHISNGIYYCVLDATDTNTLGGLIVFVHVTGALAVKVECEVMTANRYDSLVAGTDTLQADITQIGGTTQSATDLKDLADTGYDPSTHKVQGVVLTDTCTTNTDMVGTDNAALAATALTNATWTDARAGYLNNLSGGAVALAATALTDATWTDAKAAFLDASIQTVDTVVDGIQTDLSNGTDGLGALKALIDTVDGVADAILLDTGTDGVLLAAAATSAQLVDDVWDETLTGATHNIATSAGRRLREATDTMVLRGEETAQAGTASTITLHADASAINDFYNKATLIIVSGTGAGQARTIADYVGSTRVATACENWVTTPDATSTYVIRGHTCSSVYNFTADALADINAECDTALTDYDPPTRAEATSDKEAIITEVDANETKIDTVIGDTNELQTDWTNGGRLDLILDACALEATVAALNNISAANVNAEVVDVLKTDATAEMSQGAPPATPTIEEMLAYIYFMFRNKNEETSSEHAIYDDAGTTKLFKAAMSDNGTTLTKAEYVSGA